LRRSGGESQKPILASQQSNSVSTIVIVESILCAAERLPEEAWGHEPAQRLPRILTEEAGGREAVSCRVPPATNHDMLL
jgi:hypothetical protein